MSRYAAKYRTRCACFILTTAVTIYEKDNEDECSSTAFKQFAVVPTCYNASWIYYSIDLCNNPSGPTTLPNPSDTPSDTPASSQTSTPTNSSAPQTSSNGHTGAIAGGVVGGVCGLALVAGLIIFLMRRRRRHGQQQPVDQETRATAPTELSPQDTKHEMYTQGAPPQEIGRNSLHMPAVELEGDTIKSDSKKH
jgi:hypothetical protein